MAEIEGLTYFYLDLERQHPANPDLINGILHELGPIESLPLIADEFHRDLPDRNLLAGIHPDNRRKNGVVVEAVTRSLGTKYADVWTVLGTVTDPDTGLKGQVISIFPFFEGRDSNPKKHFGGPLLLKLETNLLKASSNSILSALAVWDIHDSETIKKLEKINGNENIPEVISLTAIPLFAEKLKDDGLIDDNTVVAAPDFGSLTKAREMARLLEKELIFIKKRRPEPSRVEIEGVFLINQDGSVVKKENSFLDRKRVIFFDDMIDTGGTAIGDSQAVKDAGASEVVFAATHAVFSDPPKRKAGEKYHMTLKMALDKGKIDYIYTSDSLPQYNRKIRNTQNPYFPHPKLKFISLAKPIAALMRIAADKASDEDFDLVRKCLYNPGPDKEKIEKAFYKGNISPAFKNFDFSRGVFGRQDVIVFKREPVIAS